MAHAGTTLDLGRGRQTTKEKRSGWSKAPLMVALAVMLGIAVGTAAWAVTRSAGEVAHGRNFDPALPSGAAGVADHSFDAIETHRIGVANSAIVRTYPVYDPIKQHELAYGTAATVAPVYPVYDPIKQHELAYGTAAAGVVAHGRDFDPALPTGAAGVVDHRFDAIETHRIAVANAALNSFAGGLDQIEAKRIQIANAGTGPFTSPVDNLSIRRGYDQMPGIALQPAATMDSSGRIGRAYSQGIVTQVPVPLSAADAAPTMDSSGRIGRAYSQGIATEIPVLLSAADAAPSDTPWGPRPAR